MAGHFIEDLSIGQSETATATVTEDTIQNYADVIGDHNPVHMDEEFAKTTIFKTRIAHGMLSAGYISSVFGNTLPGHGAIYMSQNLKFKAPVKIGDTVETTVTVKEIIAEKKRVVFDTVCKVGDTVVVEGEAMLMVPSKADA